ncbi:Glucooligosaccharide oxidase [Nemania serpens]|nr:Glucooligosaccharide oxidase [Nemania serpens]
MDIKKIFTVGASWPAGTHITVPGEPSFSAATQRWNIFDPPNYAVAVSPSQEDAVAEAVKRATAHGIPLLATGGRHGYSTSFGKLQHGLAIDLSNLDSIQIDADAATVTVGGGVTIGDIIPPLYKAGFQLQTGSCSRVGMVGATLGAGVSRLQGLHGLIIDALLSVRLVTADGSLITVSADSNPDLFWGLRGAGSNFGIVTSATYKIHKLVNNGQYLNADFIFPGTATTAYFQALKSFGTLPAKLIPTQGFFWDPGSNSTILVANWIYAGPEEAALNLIAPILALDPLVKSISVVPYDQVLRTEAFGADEALSVPGKNLISYSVNVKQLSVPTFESAYKEFAAFFEKNPAGRNSCAIFETYPNQAVKAVPANATAYPWRESVGNLLFQFAFPPGDSATETTSRALGQQLRRDFAATSGFPGLAVYNSYSNGDETLEQVFGSHLPRLTALKKQWDPTNVFRYQNPLLV